MKWEFCAVKSCRIYDKPWHLVALEGEVAFFMLDGYKLVEIRDRDPNALAQTIARLGEDGWEMVGCGNVDERSHAIYFKRPKP